AGVRFAATIRNGHRRFCGNLRLQWAVQESGVDFARRTVCAPSPMKRGRNVEETNDRFTERKSCRGPCGQSRDHGGGSGAYTGLTAACAFAETSEKIVVFMPPGTDNYLAQWQVGAKAKAKISDTTS